jgi:hypothetical protein
MGVQCWIGGWGNGDENLIKDKEKTRLGKVEKIDDRIEGGDENRNSNIW